MSGFPQTSWYEDVHDDEGNVFARASTFEGVVDRIQIVSEYLGIDGEQIVDLSIDDAEAFARELLSLVMKVRA